MLSSARMRRRLAWLGGVLLVAGAIAGLVLAFPGAKPPVAEKVSNAPADIVRTPRQRSFQPRAKIVLDVATRFIRTDVTEKDLAAGWDLIGPAMRVGYTRRTWIHGNTLPFPSYPAYLPRSRWNLSWSYANDVGLRVALFPRPKAKIRPIVFDIVLRKYGHGGKTRWLVSSFTPTPSGSGDYGGNSPASAGSGIHAKSTTRHESAVWLLLPLGIFLGLILGLGSFFGIRSWRNAAVYRTYFQNR